MSIERRGGDAFELEVDEEVASRRHAELTGVRVHAVTWGAVNAFLFMIWAVVGGGFPWFLFPLGGWGIPLAIHAAVATQPIDRVRVRREIEERHLQLEQPWEDEYDEDDDD